MALQENVGRDGFGYLIKQKYVTKSTAATHELIGATAGKRIKILRLVASASAAESAAFLSGTDDIMKLYFTAEDRIANLVSSDGVCVCKTSVGEALQVTLGTGQVDVYFYIQYVLVD